MYKLRYRMMSCGKKLRTPKKSFFFSRSFAAVAGMTGSADLTLGNLELNFAGEPYGSATGSAPECLLRVGEIALPRHQLLQS